MRLLAACAGAASLRYLWACVLPVRDVFRLPTFRPSVIAACLVAWVCVCVLFEAGRPSSLHLIVVSPDVCSLLSLCACVCVCGSRVFLPLSQAETLALDAAKEREARRLQEQSENDFFTQLAASSGFHAAPAALPTPGARVCVLLCVQPDPFAVRARVCVCMTAVALARVCGCPLQSCAWVFVSLP